MAVRKLKPITCVCCGDVFASRYNLTLYCSDFCRFAYKFVIDDETACWVWDGVRNRDGYAVLKHTYTVAHRVGYEMLVGPIPEGAELDHLCRNRPCVNPDHLEPVSHHVNVLRGAGLTAIHAAKTACKRGHDFTPENTYIWTDRIGDHRVCRACRRERDARKAS